MRKDKTVSGILAGYRRHRAWRKVVGVLGCAVVFCTTYALILPAITLESGVYCGKTEHIHSASCYTQVTSESSRELICTPERLGIHRHTEDCYDGAGNLVCGYADFVVHTHDAACYDGNGALICSLNEIKVHTHDASCYAIPEHTHTEGCYAREQGELICGLVEGEGHTHSAEAGCYDEDGGLICPLAESAGHQHTDDCYAWNDVLTCGLEVGPIEGAEPELVCEKPEIELHEHDEDCYETDEDGNTYLICDKMVVLEHRHTDECFTAQAVPVDATVKTCGLEESDAHTHSESCYDEEGNLICGKEETPGHRHMPQCYGTWELTCGLEEHAHSLACYSNPEADVETEEDWNAATPELTGDWRQDLIAVAKSQLGYTASEKNYSVDEDGETIHGYTRYGAWYGDPYADWNRLFVQYCLSYAGIPEADFPRDAQSAAWVEKLAGRLEGYERFQLYRSAEDYTPEPGDLVFLGLDGDEAADRVAIVTAYTQEDAPASLTVIEGGVSGAVAEQTYPMEGMRILGYGILGEKAVEYPRTLTCSGEDYTVTVTYGADAALPEDVELLAQEYSHDSETFLSRFDEAAKVYGWTEADRDAFRLFKIGLYQDGVEVEPAAQINVTVTYPEARASGQYQVVHFGEQPEQLDASATAADGAQTVDFTTDGFSDYGIMPLADGIHPEGARTGNFDIFGVNLYSIGTRGGTAAPVSGVTYTVYDEGRAVVGEYTTGDDFSLLLGADGLGTASERLPEGTYTVKQTGVPDGYTLVPQEKSFTVTAGEWNSAGIFYVYASEDYAPGKTAQVKDYENRIYEEILTAKSGSYDAQIDAGNFIFVVDRSGSMLFPTTLTPVKDQQGNDVTVDLRTAAFLSLSPNNTNMTRALSNAGLSDNELYYIIGDPTGTATVYALWKNGNTWYYQDASNYVKAQEGIDDIKYADETGGSAGGALTDFGSTTSVTYPLYKGSPYTRMTWLQYDMKLIIYELAALNPENSVTVTTFDADIKRCITRKLDPDGIRELIEAISSISTSGGTAQDRGLQHVVGDYPGDPLTYPDITCDGKSHLISGQNNYVVLITDGALNSKSENPKQALKDAATKIRDSSAKLMTVGLSMDNVTLGQELLTDTIHGGIATPGWAFLDRNAKEIASTVQNKIWGDLVTFDAKNSTVTVTDYISDSFYLVDPNGTALNVGDCITLEGIKTTSGSPDAAGQVCKDENGWYIQWQGQTIQSGNDWSGKLYIKAKEDFIGGNAIDTNKSARVDFLGEGDSVTASFPLDTPTVNVRLLPMKGCDGEATVFLGDEINRDTNGDGIPDVLADLTSRLDFQKLISSPGDPYNKAGATDDGGCSANTFTARYAAGALTAGDWEDLLGGEAVTISYTYDDASSHGPVGYFTLTLTQTGSVDQVGEDVYTGTVHVTYTAYRLGEGPEGQKRPAGTVHSSPGTEVGSEGITELKDGYGVVEADVIYKVSVVDGKITVTKELEEPAEEDTTFTFELYSQDTRDGTVNQTPYARGTIKIPAGAKTGTETHVYLYHAGGGEPTEDATMRTEDGSLTFQHLKRGSYVVAETQDSTLYTVKSAAVVEDGTNCPAVLSAAATSATFHIGYHPVTGGGEADNIIYQTGTTADGYHIVYSYEWQHPVQPGTSIAEYHGESYGEAKIVNTIQTKERTITVRKLWSEGSAPATVYVALYLDNSPVLVDNQAQLLKLDAASDWKGSFTIQLPIDQTMPEYRIREVTGVTEDPIGGAEMQEAIVVNEDNKPVYYKAAAENGDIVPINGLGYTVTYGGDVTQGLYVMNEKTKELPKTGGAGTGLYTIGGLLTICAGLLLLYRKARRKEDFASS